MNDAEEKIEKFAALVIEYDEDGNVIGRGTFDVEVVSHILQKMRSGYIKAAIAWWKWKDHLGELEWDLMRCVPHDLHDPYESNVFMVSEGQTGNHELVGFDPVEMTYYIYADLEHEQIAGMIRFI